MTEDPTPLQRVARGDAAAVRLVLDLHGPLVWSIVRPHVDGHVAEEVVQEIFVEVWRSAARYEPERASEGTFIGTIARRRLIDHRRRVGRSRTFEAVEDLDQVEARIDDRVEIADEARRARAALRRVRPVERRVLEMSIVDGHTQREIAKLLRLPLGTVKSHARRGLAQVRSHLKVSAADVVGRSSGPRPSPGDRSASVDRSPTPARLRP